MAKAVLCPVCNGKGKVYRDTGTTAGGCDKTCHGCDGRGWVEIEKTTYHYCYPTYEFPTYYPYTTPYYTDWYWR